jgi:hypothetical protein
MLNTIIIFTGGYRYFIFIGDYRYLKHNNDLFMILYYIVLNNCEPWQQ